jgi:hypothetical protein
MKDKHRKGGKGVKDDGADDFTGRATKDDYGRATHRRGRKGHEGSRDRARRAQ